MPTALAIAAHPDDIEFVMAGTLLLLREAGWEIHYFNVTTGEMGSTVMNAALKLPDVKAKMKVQGLVPLSNTPAEFASLISNEVDYWAKVIPSIGLQAE